MITVDGAVLDREFAGCRARARSHGCLLGSHEQTNYPRLGQPGTGSCYQYHNFLIAATTSAAACALDAAAARHGLQESRSKGGRCESPARWRM